MEAEFEEPQWRSCIPQAKWGWIPWQLSWGQFAAAILAAGWFIHFLHFLHFTQRLQGLGLALRFVSFLCPLEKDFLPFIPEAEIGGEILAKYNTRNTHGSAG